MNDIEDLGHSLRAAADSNDDKLLGYAVIQMAQAILTDLRRIADGLERIDVALANRTRE